MHKVYSLKRGVEFRGGVKTKILTVAIIIGLFLVFKYLDQIIEVIIAGF